MLMAKDGGFGRILAQIVAHVAQGMNMHTLDHRSPVEGRIPPGAPGRSAPSTPSEDPIATGARAECAEHDLGDTGIALDLVEVLRYTINELHERDLTSQPCYEAGGHVEGRTRSNTWPRCIGGLDHHRPDPCRRIPPQLIQRGNRHHARQTG